MSNPSDFVIENGVLKKYTGPGGDVVVPEGVTSIGDSAFSLCRGLTSITLPEGVTSIGSFAFKDCSSLKSITLSESLMRIGRAAFEGTEFYKNFDNWTDGVLYLGKTLIKAKNFLQSSYSVRDGITCIANDAFSNCTSLTSITLPEGLTSIGDDVFSWCSGLTSITLPAGITSIGSFTFFGCFSLTDIVLPENLASIGFRAFGGCEKLKLLTMPTVLPQIEEAAFSGCISLANGDGLIVVGDRLFGYTGSANHVMIPEHVKKIDGSVFNGCGSLERVELPVGLEELGSYTFKDCILLEAISIPDGVHVIGKETFSGCKRLSDVRLPEQLERIEEKAFYGCLALTEFRLPDCLNWIGKEAFYASGLTGVSCPNKLTNLETNTFAYCKALVWVRFPAHLKTIGDGCFQYCLALKNPELPEGLERIGQAAFVGCQSLTELRLPKGFVEIGKDAFKYCDHLTIVELPDSLQAVGQYAFYNCGELDLCASSPAVIRLLHAEDYELEGARLKNYRGPGGDVTLPDTITELGDTAFAGCYMLHSVTFPGNISRIGRRCFYACGEVELIGLDPALRAKLDAEEFEIKNDVLKSYNGMGGNVIVPEGVTSIGYEAFKGCGSLKSISLPEELTSIGDWAFFNCSSLTSITLPEGVTSIGNLAFFNCSSLTSITLPEGLTSFGSSAFKGCSSLTSITLPEGLKSICDRAFEDCSSLTSITLPDGLTNIGKEAFEDCSSLKTFTLTGNKAKLPKDVFGSSLPEGLAGHISNLYSCMTDGALKQYVLDGKIWKKLDAALQAEIFLARQGKALDSAYAACVEPPELEGMGAAILDRLGTVNPSSKDCTAAASYMTLFHKTVSTETLKKIYEKLKPIKAGAKAVKTVEAHVELMEKLGSAVTVDTSLSPAAQKVMAVLITEKRNAKDLEKTFKDFYSLTYKDLPILQAADGSAVEPLVSAWLFTAHEELEESAWGQPDVVAGYQKAGLRPEASELLTLLDRESLQEALLKLADANLGMTGRSKKMFLAYPICRYADEALMAELCVRAPKWRSSVSGDYAPALWTFRHAVWYSNKRAAMLFAERYHELEDYAKVRGTDADTIRDKYLSDVGLDEQGGKSYDLGNQTVTARLQKDLSFFFELPGGKTAKSLPKKGADPDKYAAANKDFAEMRKSVKRILKNRGKVLFEDFISGRERPSADWQDAYLHNPLLREAASLVVWAQGKQTFTLTEACPIDSAGQPYSITAEPITVAHPMEMKPNDVTAWQKFITKHGLKQPFAQMWETVRKAEEIAKDRYVGCMIPYYRFVSREKHGIHVTDENFHNEISIEIDGCDTDIKRIDWQWHAIDMNDCFEVKSFGFKKYTRQVNHIVAYLDRITVWDRVCKDDLAVMDLMPCFTLAQITEFIAAAQEANATNVLAALLEYKNVNFADFDPMDEFTLEW